MRRLIFSSFGEPAQVLALDEAPAPEPRAGEVRVRLSARPIHPSDLLTLRGQYGHLPRLPAVPGCEGAGVIDALGAGVSGWRIGRRVIPAGTEATWQEFITVPADRLIPVPDSLADDAACQALVNPLTAHLLLFDALEAKEGDWVAQTAAGSAVGKAVIRLAARRGVNLINLVRRRAGAAEIAAIGGANVVVTAEEDLARRLAEITGGKPVLKALDAVSGVVGAKLASALAPGAKLVIYGALAMQPAMLDPRRFIFGQLTVTGFWLPDWLRASPRARIAPIVAELMTLIAAGDIVLPVAARYDLGDFAEAVAAAERPNRGGKVILTG